MKHETNFLSFLIDLVLFNITDNNNNLISNVHEEDHVESVLHVQHQYTQTESMISNHSPRKTILRGRIIALHREVRKLKRQLQRQTNNIKICARKISLEEYCEVTNEFLSPQVANFVKTQVRLNKYKSAKGRKYSLPFKKFCLDILLCGGNKTYNSFAQKFILPNVRTLQRMIEHLKFSSGLHDFVFDFLKEKLKCSLSSLDKYCILCIDEASIKANLYYNINRDEVIGFEDLGDNKLFLSACNVATLMIRRICTNWKQPLAYFLLNSSFSARKLIIIFLK